jgi:hypothetical protein
LQGKGNAVLQASLQRRKKALHERRLALEQDVISIFGNTFFFFFFLIFPKRAYIVAVNLNVFNASLLALFEVALSIEYHSSISCTQLCLW